jgi:DNA mismatch repair protein MSH2
MVATYVPVMEDLNRVLAELDVLLRCGSLSRHRLCADVGVSFAHVSVTAPTPFVRPTITPSGTGDIVLEARLCLLV